ncbi:YceI family protein [Polaribacter sargassicola]|uniref:YceI family protein n=1 Tax=Polaribacter sargassicola TaxID=2836891 RepID=UPI001F3A435F|nr:YceI family protein [Polaribacter sp. DS7-9]MCG1037114.1 YceI family protein [Polaribacter sp. DS7-9]
MKKIFVLIIVLLTLFSFTKRNLLKKDTVIKIGKESKLEIIGTTNLNKFNCNFNFLDFDKTIPLSFQTKDNKIYFKDAILKLKNSCFDCGNKMMNKDFYKLLKSEKFPQILLNLKEVEKKETTTEALVEMTIAGVSKTYKIPVITENDNTELLVSGKLNLNIEDYHLEAPKKMLGLVVVSEMINIHFNLILKES